MSAGFHGPELVRVLPVSPDGKQRWFEFEMQELGEAAEVELRMAGFTAQCGMSGDTEWDWLLFAIASEPLNPRDEAVIEAIARKYNGREPHAVSCAVVA